MDVREKLAELLSEYFDIGDSYAYNLTRVKSAFACGTMGFDDFEEFDEETVEDIVSHLIARGVTVQEWISVKDRLPEPFVSVLVQMPGEQPFPTVREGFISNDGIWQSAMFRREPGEVTHWQYLPQPPKGE